jgi:hypothetical protein
MTAKARYRACAQSAIPGATPAVQAARMLIAENTVRAEPLALVMVA